MSAHTFSGVVRYNPWLGALLLIVGLANLALTILADGDTVGALSGGVLTILGVLFLRGTAVIAQPPEVVVRSVVQTTLKRVPIGSLADLVLDDKVLRLRADGNKIVNLGWGTVRSSDIEALRTAIAQAQP